MKITLDDYLKRAVDIMRLKHYSLKTEECYTGWIRRFWEFLVKAKTEGTPEQKMEAFLTHLARNLNVAASTQMQAFNAIRFLYLDVQKAKLGNVDALRAVRPEYVRPAPAKEDIVRLLTAVRDEAGYPVRLVTRLLYEMGMRVNEPLNLRRKDVDLKQGRITLYETKGNKSRVVRIPDHLIEPMRAQLRASRAQWELNMSTQRVPAKLPGAMERKSTSLGLSWQWWWVFPSRKSCVDKRSGRTVWWHAHEKHVQVGVRKAALACGLEGWITPHVLRHACATHLVDAGYSPRDVQLLLGHASLETTMRYVHGDAMRIPSPMEIQSLRKAPLQMLPPLLPTLQLAA